MTYYITLEVRVQKSLGQRGQDKLRDAILSVLDEAGRTNDLPYNPDIATATISEEA